MNDFRNYITKHLKMNGATFDDFVGKSKGSYISPTILEERTLNVSQMDVFSRLMMDRIIFFGTVVDSYSANIVQAQLLYLASTDKSDISLYINSPGGSVSDGLAIYDTMQFIDCDVATMCTGMAASMGAVLLVSGAKGKRASLKHSRVMIHQPSGGADGKESDIEIAYNEIKKCKIELYDIISKHSGQKIEKIEADADRDYWMSSEEAKNYGIIDKVL